MIELHDDEIRFRVRRRLDRLKSPAVSMNDIKRRASSTPRSWVIAFERVAVVAVVATVLVWGAASRPPTAGSETVDLPHTPAGGAPVICNAQLLVGTLEGDPADARHAWVIAGNGTRTDVAWPAGYSARFVPGLQVLDAVGVVVARGGQEVRVGGSLDLEGLVFNICQGPR